MDFSVIVCTHNRSDGLITILKSLETQKIPDSFMWEVVVIDNNSTDDTYDAVQKFVEGSPLLVAYFFESKVGLSHARNRGIVEAKGSYVLFVEDDEIADKNLISQLHDTFQMHDCDCVGGRIKLRFEDKKPDWLIKELWPFLGFLDYGDKSIPMDEIRYPFGGNMAFKKNVFNKIGMFDVNLGRKGTQLFGGEEHDIFMRLLKSGLNGIYQPGAVVHHRINKHRMTKRYFRQLHFKQGVQQTLLSREMYTRSFLGTPFFLFVQLARSVINFLKSLLNDHPGIGLRKEMIVWHFLGQIRGNYLRGLSNRS